MPESVVVGRARGESADENTDREVVVGRGIQPPLQDLRAYPVRLSFVADILAQQEGLEPVLGGFEIADGVLPTTGEIPDGLDRGGRRPG